MFKFVVFSALVCVASAAPGFLHGGYALPAATSYSSRVDVHSAPIVKTYAAPAIVAAPVIAKTISYEAPIVASYGLGHGYGYNLGHGYGYNLGHGIGGIGYGHGW